MVSINRNLGNAQVNNLLNKNTVKKTEEQEIETSGNKITGQTKIEQPIMKSSDSANNNPIGNINSPEFWHPNRQLSDEHMIDLGGEIGIIRLNHHPDAVGSPYLNNWKY